MTAAVLSKPTDVKPAKSHGGDDGVERASDGRPRIRIKCPKCDGTGRMPSEKRPGNTVKCKGGCEDGVKALLYSRTTTYIDVMEDKSNLIAWKARMALQGAAIDPSLLDGVTDYIEALDQAQEEEDIKAAKGWLLRRAESACVVAGSDEKADQGTLLHNLSELVDMGKELPIATKFEDVVDLDAYKRATENFRIRHMEELVVHDEFKIAGTPDRVSEYKHPFIHPETKLLGNLPLIAPDGHEFLPGELIITDLKTGTVDYGALKMAMQLAVYSRSVLYDKVTFERKPLVVNQKWGIIMHLPAGSGECTLLWADLELGWEAVLIAKQIRALRNEGRKALTRFDIVAHGV